MIRVAIMSAMAQRNMRYVTDLSKATGLNYAHLGHIISGDIKQIKLDTLDKLCQALDCGVGDLLVHEPDGES
jgi:putative transcriptional regulator